MPPRVKFIHHVKTRVKFPHILSSKATFDVILGPGVERVREDLFADGVFDQLTSQEKCSVIGNTRGLLDGVRYKHDCVILLQRLQ